MTITLNEKEEELNLTIEKTILEALQTRAEKISRERNVNIEPSEIIRSMIYSCLDVQFIIS